MENYTYPFKHFLTKDLSLIYDINTYEHISVCAYEVNVGGKYPFLKYLLCKDIYGTLSFPIMPQYEEVNKENVINYSHLFLSTILNASNFEEYLEKVSFNGIYEYNNGLYLFFDLTKLNVTLNEIYSTEKIRFALIDEIVNCKHICNIPISYNVTDFFVSNDACIYLCDSKGEQIEIPSVGYVGKSSHDKLNFTYMFGETAKNKQAILGPYYYFTSFNRAIRTGGWSHDYKPEYSHNKIITDSENGRYTKGGIVRFALFTGKTKYVENMPDDPVDESEIKKERLRDETLNTSYEILTLRISDHDGNWTNTYDSIYLGNIELDDGSFIDESHSQQLVIKDYEQQIPLSYHFIDKSKLGDKYNSKQLYNIQ